MKTRLLRVVCAFAAVLAVALMTKVTYDSLEWLGRKFPGFLIMQNRVIPSVSLPDWGDNNHIYQNQIVRVDGVDAESAEAIYEYLATRPVGSPVKFTLKAPGGVVREIERPLRLFTTSDYFLLFGSFLVNGFFFLLIGLGLFFLVPGSPAARGVLSTCVSAGVFITTAVDLYGPPYVFFRLHVVSEAIAAACFIHLAAVFPTDRLGDERGHKLFWVYAPFAALVYYMVRDDPAGYTFLHLIASGGFGICTTGIVISILLDLFFTRSPLARRRIAVVALGSITGILPLTLIWAVSGLLGGKIPLNAVALTAFFFPMSIAFAVLKRDLFEIDIFLRRTIAYSVVMISIIGVYFLVLFGYEYVGPGQSLLSRSPIFLALLNLVLLFVIAPIRERAQRLIDQLFFRQSYLVEDGLTALSDRLATARALDGVEEHTRLVLADTVCPKDAWILLQKTSSHFASASRPAIEIPERLLERLRVESRVTRYESDDGEGEAAETDFWRGSGIDVLLQLRADGSEVRLLALGPKLSGHPYNAHDIGFLETAANQISLAVANAAAFDQLGDLNRNLEALNEGLEAQVESRTAELNGANGELNRSLDKLQCAYRELEVNHAGLLRADRLATLGRLTAGIAHEINTPLSAVLNALKIISDLSVEYGESISDPTVNQDDHREIAKEILATATSAREWGNRAAAYVRSVKQHGRESRTGTAHKFALSEVVDRTGELLSHRLRAAACQVEIQDQAPGVEVWGDPGRLGQVLINLITNAVDAYEDNGVEEGTVRVCIRRENDGAAIIEVTDEAGGIPADVLPHVFDELYTTKEPGRGTGLGLWISRNIMEEGFGGTLTAISQGKRTQFVVSLPSREGVEVPIDVAPHDASASSAAA